MEVMLWLVSVVLVGLYQVPSATGLDCYHCIYFNDIDEDDIPTSILPGNSEIRKIYGKDCSKNDLPSDWIRTCNILNGSLLDSIFFKSPESLISEPVCVKLKVKFPNLDTWVRGCFPKELMEGNFTGTCQNQNLNDIWKWISELPGVPDFDATRHTMDACYCDTDNCNSATHHQNYIMLLIMPLLYMTFKKIVQ